MHGLQHTDTVYALVYRARRQVIPVEAAESGDTSQ